MTAKRQSFINKGKNEFEHAFIAMVYDYVVELGNNARHMNDYRLWRLMNDENAFYEGWRSPLKVASVSHEAVDKTFEYFREKVREEVGLPRTEDVVVEVVEEYKREGLIYER